MKYSKFLLLLFFLLQKGFTYNIKEHSSEPSLVYCPEKIVCETDNIKSCKAEINSNRWDKEKIGFVAAVKKGEYYFDGATSLIGMQCLYSNEKLLSAAYLPVKAGAVMVPYVHKETAWNHEMGYCQSKVSKSCPFKLEGLLGQQNEIAFTNGERGFVYAYVNDQNVLYYLYFFPSPYSYMNAEKLSQVCGSVKECKIEFKTLYHYILNGMPAVRTIGLGSVIVDLSNNVKITKIMSDENSGFAIKTLEDFNTVNFESLQKTNGLDKLQ